MTREVALAALFALAACSDDTRLVLQLPPPENGESSLFVVIESPGARTITAAVAGEPFGPLTASAPEETPLTVSVLYFRETLEELELEAGEVNETSANTCGRFPLADAARAFVQNGDTFHAAEKVPESLLNIHLRVRCPCVQLSEIAVLELPSRNPVRYQTRLEDGTTLLVSSSHFTTVDEELRAVHTTSTATNAASAFLTETGEFWLGTGYGRIFRGPNYRELTFFAEVPNEELAWAEGGLLEEGSSEVYFLSHNGPLYRASASGLETIVEERSTLDGDQDGSIAWLGPRRVFALQEDDFGILDIDLLRTEGGPLIREPWELDSGVPSAIDTAEGKIYLSTLIGLVFTRRGEDWIEVPARGTPEGIIRKFISYRGGFFAVGNYGFAVQYHPYAGFCEHRIIGEGLDLLFATEVGENIIVSGKIANPDDEPNTTQRAYLLGPR
jgi:hypothetical protein